MLLDTLRDDAGARPLQAAETLERGSVRLAFRARADGPLVTIAGGDGRLELRVADGALVYESHVPDRHALIEAEDTAPLADGTWHSAAVVVDDRGTRLFVDGYPAFAGTASAFTADVGDSPRLHVGTAPGITVRGFVLDGWLPTPAEVRAVAVPPRPLVEFAADTLSRYDVAGVAELHEGSVALRYRVRGPGQGGVLLAAGAGGAEVARLTVSEQGISWEMTGRGGRWRTFRATGVWDDGRWHDVVVRSARGAVEIFVDGYRELHAPGTAFFADVTGLDEVVIGRDTRGSRLWGEVKRAAVYPLALGDAQVKLLAGVEPLETVAVFDRGLAGSASYRIPSIVRTPAGTLVAGADQRTAIANDSPNHINFVVRRSEDDGRTWGPLQLVVRSAGSGPAGASVIDSCLVVDEEADRVLAVIDHFPGGVGQPNNEAGTGMTAAGELLLHDSSGARHVRRPDGSVTTVDGEPTAYHVDAAGVVTLDGQPAGNVHLRPGEDPAESLLTERTCFLQVLTSDDDGLTWQGPVDINHQVKEPWMRFLGTGPGSGIQLRHGAHRGRLVVPVYYEGDVPKRVSAAVIYSDDHGATWTRGASPNDGRSFKGAVLDSRTVDDDEASLHESTVVERRDGSLLLLMRNQHPSGRVLVSRSGDGGATWGPVEPHPQLPEIFCQPNAVAPDPTTDRVVFANATQLLPFRGAGVLRLSYDGGETWAASRTVNPGHHVYQSMTALADGGIGLLWEHEWQGLLFTRIPPGWFDGSGGA